MLAVVTTPAAAQALVQWRVDLLGRDVVSLPESGPEGWTIERSQSPSLVPSYQAPVMATTAALQPSNAMTQTMLWARRERLGLGLGVEQRWSPVAGHGITVPPAARDAGLLVGLAWTTGESSQLTLAAPLLTSRPPEGLAWTGLDRGPEREMRFGLEFRKRDPYAELRRGALMKFELSRDTTVSLKPRQGRVGFTLNSRW
jgi:hypothetical protein